MHDALKNLRFSVVPLPVEGSQPVELARTLAVHPLTYQELPYDPEAFYGFQFHKISSKAKIHVNKEAKGFGDKFGRLPVVVSD